MYIYIYIITYLHMRRSLQVAYKEMKDALTADEFATVASGSSSCWSDVTAVADELLSPGVNKVFCGYFSFSQ